jgi:UDPglucose 6-dehydrogenase
MNNKLNIGFIGQGWVGKNYADNFENRGYKIVRFGLEPIFHTNKDLIKKCQVVFIAVPTPTTVSGFDSSIVDSVIHLVDEGGIVVIKSTMSIGESRKIQEKHPKHIIIHAPEFLSESSAYQDASNPERNIIGISKYSDEYMNAAKLVLSVLPEAPFSLVCVYEEAEFIKYSHNIHGYIQVVFGNLLLELADELKLNWEHLFESFKADPLMVARYLNPVHKSGKGAGGNCFIKDFEAFLRVFKSHIKDGLSVNVLESIRDKNIDLLIKSNKDIDKLVGVYGNRIK